MTHSIVSYKLKALSINPFIHHLVFPLVDYNVTEYLPVNKRVPQGTILDPITFLVMVYDIQALHPSQNALVKYADDLSLSIPVGDGYEDNADGEVRSKYQ